MCEQILLTSTIQNIWRTLRRTCILILGFKGLRRKLQSQPFTLEVQTMWNGLDLFYIQMKTVKQFSEVINYPVTGKRSFKSC